jgi:hypothetical protein
MQAWEDNSPGLAAAAAARALSSSPPMAQIINDMPANVTVIEILGLHCNFAL